MALYSSSRRTSVVCSVLLLLSLLLTTTTVHGETATCNICDSVQVFLSSPEVVVNEVPDEFGLSSTATCSDIYKAGIKGGYSGDCDALKEFASKSCSCGAEDDAASNDKVVSEAAKSSASAVVTGVFAHQRSIRAIVASSVLTATVSAAFFMM
jgi:energy-coupling factor transporter transmembrane protein EcfT